MYIWALPSGMPDVPNNNFPFANCIEDEVRKWRYRENSDFRSVNRARYLRKFSNATNDSLDAPHNCASRREVVCGNVGVNFLKLRESSLRERDLHARMRLKNADTRAEDANLPRRTSEALRRRAALSPAVSLYAPRRPRSMARNVSAAASCTSRGHSSARSIISLSALVICATIAQETHSIISGNTMTAEGLSQDSLKILRIPFCLSKLGNDLSRVASRWRAEQIRTRSRNDPLICGCLAPKCIVLGFCNGNRTHI